MDYKRIILVLLIAIMTVPAMGQISYGVRGGLSYTSLVQRMDDKNEVHGWNGFSIGGLVNVPVYRRFSVQPELAFTRQGGGYYSGLGDEFSRVYSKYNYYSIQMPVNMVYTVPISGFRMSILFGPAIDCSLFDKSPKICMQEELGVDKNKVGNLKTWDFGVNVGLEGEYNNVFFSITALCGVLDRRSIKYAGEKQLYQNNLTFSLGYHFR